MRGGVKDNSDTQYKNNYKEILRTMVRLDVPLYEALKLPVKKDLRVLHLADCIKGPTRKHPNQYPTVRNKNRALDYVNQLAGYDTSWSQDIMLRSITHHIKKYYSDFE